MQTFLKISPFTVYVKCDLIYFATKPFAECSAKTFNNL